MAQILLAMAQLLASKPTARPAPLAGPAPRLGVAARFAAPAAPAAARRLAARGGVQEITTEEDYMRFIAGPELTLVDFYTSWCGETIEAGRGGGTRGLGEGGRCPPSPSRPQPTAARRARRLTAGRPQARAR